MPLFVLSFTEDPVRMFDHEPKPPDSLLKVMGDIFSSPTTSGIFYTNDMMVFIDIIIRQLNDLASGDSVSLLCIGAC